MMRVGIGNDVHKLTAGRQLIIGGVKIQHDKGLMGHSDADVLLHAICDALLGAAGLGDLGEHFPDSDPRFKNFDSRKFLSEVISKLKMKGFTPFNVDSVVIAEVPRLGPYRLEMRKNIAEILALPMEQVNVKATTEEGLGFTGKKEGIAAWAVVTICPCTSTTL